MSVLGPSRLILLKAGKFDYAEVDLHGSLHLVGPNNVGKTSLVAALQFLYVDDQRALSFSRTLAESRRYYFPDHYSHILFECLTPSGFRVVGVHGLGPLRQYEFERFTYQGEFHPDDYLDEERKPREPDAIKLRLVDRAYTPLEPQHLRAALTGAGDSRTVLLGLVPLRQKNQYEHFRQVFQNLLRLSHLRQEDLKKLLIDAHQSEFHRTELDLSTDYKAQYRRVTEDRESVARMKLAEPLIRKAIEAAAERDRHRKRLPRLWNGIKQRHIESNFRYNEARAAFDQERETIQSERGRTKEAQKSVRDARDELVRLRDAAERKIEKLDQGKAEFADFLPEWAAAKLRELRDQADELAHKILSAGKAVRAEVERDLRELRHKQDELEAKLSHGKNLAGARLRGMLAEEEIRAAFTMLNPDLLSLPVRTGGETIAGGGVIVSEERRLVEFLRSLATDSNHGDFEEQGLYLDVTSIKPLDLENITNPERLQSQLRDVAQKIGECEGLLSAIEQRDALASRREQIDKQRNELARKLERHTHWQQQMQMYAQHRADRDALGRQIEDKDREQTEQMERIEQIARRLEEIDLRVKEINQQENWLGDRIRSLAPPPVEVPAEVEEAEGIAGPLEELLDDYEYARPREAQLSQTIADLLAQIALETSDRYAGVDEAATLSSLERELDGLEERARAVEDLWKALIVQVRQALKRLVEDLDKLRMKISDLNRRLSSTTVSNLDRVHLSLVEEPDIVLLLRKIIDGNELPLFANRREVDTALVRVGELLQTRPRLSLLDLFRVHFAVTGADGVEKHYKQLDQIESNGTTITIKVLVNLMLLRSLLAEREVRIPFYLDEVASLDAANLSAIVELARQMGFIAVLASPDPRDIADAVYYLTDHKGRVTLDLQQRVRMHHERSC
ncbi:hypothetical protein [Sorangium sp. So ce1182]|uniref:hypothetical protein n=1 Tax=Sorangium sp. So ce1182 TaxID=3133334 RepID=UPI003F60050A